MMASFDSFLARKRDEYGDEFDLSELHPQFRPFYGTDQRIKVSRRMSDGTEWTRTGRIGVTTGWRPAFLLMSRSDSIGSSDVLSADDQVVAVKRGREYGPPPPQIHRPVTNDTNA